MKTIGKLALGLIGSLILVCAINAQSNIGGGASTGSNTGAPNNLIYASPTCASGQTRCVQLPQSGGILYDCSVLITSSLINCPDAVFSTSTMAVGMNVFAVCNPQLSGGGSEVTGSTLVVPYGTISTINSTTQITVSTTSTAACTASGNTGLVVAWGYPADTQFTTAWTAATAAPDCSGLEVSAGVWFLTTPDFNTSTAACKLGVGIMRTGPSFKGQGMASTILVVTPSLNLSNCTLGTSGAACFFTSGGVQLYSFQMTGLYNPIGGNNIKHLVELNSATVQNTTTEMFDVSIAGWGGTSINTVCLDVDTNTPEPLFTGIAVQGCYWNVQLDGTATGGFITDSFIEDCNNGCLRINGSNDAITYGTVMGPVMDNGGTGSTVILQGSGAFWEDFGGVLDFANSQGSNQHTLLTLNATNEAAYLHNTLFQPNSTATFATINQNSTGGYVLLDHAQVTSGSAASGLACNSSTTNKYAVTNGTKFFGGPAVNSNCVAANFSDPSGIIQAGAQTAGTAVNFGTAISSTALVAASTTTGFLVSTPIHVSFNTRQVTAGVGCSAGSNTVTPSITYTSPGGTAQTISPTVLTISANGTIDSLASANGQDFYITVKAGSALNYSTTSSLASTGCSTTPQYAVDVRVL